jgi:ferredoxin-NADP reductase
MTARIIMRMRVAEARLITRDVLLITLTHPRRRILPAWSAGAHVDVKLPDGKTRQYSLCGDPSDLAAYRIAVKHETAGRGGSKWMHENVRIDAEIHISTPWNNLPLVIAPRYVLLGGGIGITPLVSMAYTLSAEGKDFELHYCARSSEAAPLLAELRAICGDRLQCWFSSAGQRYDVASLGSPQDGTMVYACGPQRLLDAVQSTLELGGWREEQLRMEVFRPIDDGAIKPEPFYARIASTGEALYIPADQSLLEILRGHGVVLASSCELGVCGSCECGYIEGAVIHRDKVLPAAKRQDRIIPCVSRARVSVTLDL